MCLIAFALDAHPSYRLILASNRDEYYHRSADPLGWWLDRPGILAGRDRLAQGTWLGIERRGRVAALTNVREATRDQPRGPSRGDLPRGFLESDRSPLAHASALKNDTQRSIQSFAGFNLLMFDLSRAPGTACWISNREPAARVLSPGVYGLSNHLIDTPWPKVQGLKLAMQEALPQKNRQDLEKSLFAALADRKPALDPVLPRSAIPIERERILSAAFVHSADYGTRASTLMLIERTGRAALVERTWTSADAAAADYQERRFSFQIDSSPN